MGRLEATLTRPALIHNPPLLWVDIRAMGEVAELWLRRTRSCVINYLHHIAWVCIRITVFQFPRLQPRCQSGAVCKRTI